MTYEVTNKNNNLKNWRLSCDLPQLALLSLVGHLGDLNRLADHGGGIPLVAGIVLPINIMASSKNHFESGFYSNGRLVYQPVILLFEV